MDDAVNETELRKEWTSLPGGGENARRRTVDGMPMDMNYLRSLFERFLSEEKLKAGL